MHYIKLYNKNHAHMMYGDDNEGSAPSTLSDHRDEAWIDGAAMVVMDTTGD